LNLDSFDEKLIIQKAVYLAQQMGMKSNYEFGWYVRGVYSSPLTVDMYKARNEQLNYVPESNEEGIIEKLLSIQNIFDNPVRTFELISTIVYAQRFKNMGGDEVKRFTKSVKPWFSEKEIENAVEQVKKLNKEFN